MEKVVCKLYLNGTCLVELKKIYLLVKHMLSPISCYMVLIML